MNVRALAAKIITEVFQKKIPLNTVLAQYKNQCRSIEDQSLLQALCFGVFRFYPRLQFIASSLLEKPFKERDQDLLNLICVGVFQLDQMRIPDHAAISETVEAARLLKKPWSTGLINAVLRNFQRKKEDFVDANQKNQEVVKYMHPAWLIQKIKNEWPDHWQDILIANNALPPLILRINIQKCTREEYLELSSNAGIEADIFEPTISGIKLNKPYDIKQLPGFKEGFFSVQDGAAQWAAYTLDLAPNLRILDACSAPGGKLTHMLELLEFHDNLSEVIAVDNSKERTMQIQENIERLSFSLNKAKIITADARKPNQFWDGNLFDRILCDAPCSALGVIRRHPDIKMLREPEDLERMRINQLQLLQSLWPLLKPNGLLVYSTCSIANEENELVIQKFMEEHQDQDAELELDALKSIFSSLEGQALQFGFQFLPGQNDFDGFYYARIRKKIE